LGHRRRSLRPILHPVPSCEGDRPRITRATILAVVLDEVRTDPAAWWHLAWWLAATNRGHDGVNEFSEDLTGRTSWILLGEHEQEQLLDNGITYLATHQPRPRNWAGHPQVSSSAGLPDWSGVYLLSTLARHYPERLQALPPGTGRKWHLRSSGPGTPGRKATNGSAAASFATKQRERSQCELAD
jgi:hypothetical protein